MIQASRLSSFENFSLTAKVTKPLSDLNNSIPILGSATSRIFGCVIIPIASVADTAAHLSLGVGKLCTGIVISPYNTVAGAFFPKWAAPRDLELSSALIHVIRVVECLFTAVILPFVCLINPDRAHDFMSYRYGSDESAHQKSIEKLNQEIESLKQQLKAKELEASAPRTKSGEPGSAPSSTPNFSIPTPPPFHSSVPKPPPMPKSTAGKPKNSTTSTNGDSSTVATSGLFSGITGFDKNKLKKVQAGGDILAGQTEDQDDKWICAKHKPEIMKFGPALQEVKDHVENLIDYLDSSEGEGLEDADPWGEFSDLLKDYCKEFKINFAGLEEKPFKVSQEDLQKVQSYFNNFLARIEARQETERQHKKKTTEEEEDVKTYMANILKQKTLEADQKLAEKKGEALDRISFLDESDLKAGIDKLKPIHKIAFPNHFAQKNSKLLQAFKNYEEFAEMQEKLAERIRAANNLQAIEAIKKESDYQRVFDILADISREYRDYETY